MGILNRVSRGYDEDFASPADYEDGFVESDGERLRREVLEARERENRAREREAAWMGRESFDFSRDGDALRLPSPEAWAREMADLTEQYRGLSREDTAAMGLEADGSPVEKPEPDFMSGASGRVLQEAERLSGENMENTAEFGE